MKRINMNGRSEICIPHMYRKCLAMPVLNCSKLFKMMSRGFRGQGDIILISWAAKHIKLHSAGLRNLEMVNFHPYCETGHAKG